MNILEIYSPDQNLSYALSIGSFTQNKFINILDQEAREAAPNRVKTGADIIIILDNYSIDKSLKLEQKKENSSPKACTYFFFGLIAPN